MGIKQISITLLLTCIMTPITTAHNLNVIQNESEKYTINKIAEPHIQILNLNEANGSNFVTNNAKINKKGQRILNNFVTQVITSNVILSKIIIVGHTDNTGSEKANKHLSKQRATAVANYLVNKGLDNTLMKIAGYGGTHPIANNDSQMGRAQNRRVFIQIHGKKPNTQGNSR